MQGFWCKKIGMTQIFEPNGTLVPVTVFEAGHWLVTQVKTEARDGYAALQVGLVKPRFTQERFAQEWLVEPERYFAVRREIACDAHSVENYAVGTRINPTGAVQSGDLVKISGVTIGRGFQGGVKRHGFSGGRGSHGCKLGRKPGSLSFMRSRGRVIKNRRMAGHMGVEACTIRGLRVISTREVAGASIYLIKGSVAGKAGSLLFVHKL